MSNTLILQTNKPVRVRSLILGVLVLGCALGTVSHVAAQQVTPPVTPIAITPPEGNTAYLLGHAVGTQGYVCLPTPTGGTSWTINNARPEATLFTDVFGQPVQIITHFTSIDEKPKQGVEVSLAGNATWQSSFDTSKVWAVATGHINAGDDRASCPNEGAIACLLLQSIGNEVGPTGGKLLARTTFVQRLNTKGGSAPTTACTMGQTQLMPYTADYFFYRKSE